MPQAQIQSEDQDANICTNDCIILCFLSITVYLFLFLTFIVDRVKMIVKQNEKVDQIYHCRCRSAVCGWFNDVAGNMIVVLGPK